MITSTSCLCVDNCWDIDRVKIWDKWRGALIKDICRVCGAFHMLVCSGVCMVMGAVGLASAKRDIPAGDTISWPEHYSVSEYVVYLHRRADLSHHAVPHEVWSLLLLRWRSSHHDSLHCALPS